MSLIACGSIHESHEWFSDDSQIQIQISDFSYYALFTKYNKINIYRNYMKYKKKEEEDKRFLCVWLLYYASNFADSRMKVPRYRSSPTS